MTGFAHNLSETFFTTWQVRLWRIKDREQQDKYGHFPDHPRYQYEIHDNYISDIPYEKRFYAMAIQYCNSWYMSVADVLDMDYAEFVQMAAVNKAVTLRRPWWEGEFGDHVFLWEKTTGQPQQKPRRNN